VLHGARICGDAPQPRNRRENVTLKFKELLTQTIESMSWKKIEDRSKDEVKKKGGAREETLDDGDEGVRREERVNREAIGAEKMSGSSGREGNP